MIRAQPLREDLKALPDLTPLLDIIFIVMVFLLLTANIQVQSLKVDVPKTQDEAALSNQQKNVITLNILAQDPKWAIQGKTYESWEVFKQTLLDEVKASPKTPLMVAADKHAKVEDMLALLAFLQSQNIQTANLMMEAQ